MPRSFIIKPTDEVVSEAESWLGFRDNDPVRIEADEIYHLIHEADNVLMLAETDRLRSACRDYANSHKLYMAPSYLRIFFRPRPVCPSRV